MNFSSSVVGLGIGNMVKDEYRPCSGLLDLEAEYCKSRCYRVLFSKLQHDSSFLASWKGLYLAVGGSERVQSSRSDKHGSVKKVLLKFPTFTESDLS